MKSNFFFAFAFDAMDETALFKKQTGGDDNNNDD